MAAKSQRKDKKPSERRQFLRMGQSYVPDQRLRRYLFVLFCGATFMALWTPTQWIGETWKKWDFFRDGMPWPPASPQSAALLPAPFSLNETPSAAWTQTPAADAKAPRAVTFRVLLPTAQEVLLGGTFNDFDARKNTLERRADGLWEATLELAPGRYLYKFKVDGQWRLDPTNPDRTPEPHASSILVIR